jgi:8-oxo-dGTP pyrophosphatase MutT (NUDIX family)
VGHDLAVTKPVLRPTARVLLVDDASRALLFRGQDPTPGSIPFWFPPGGAIEEGESASAAAIREVQEETGLVLASAGPHVFDRRHQVVWDGVETIIEETWYFARCASFAIDTTGWTELERATIATHRWWTLDELAASTERLVPADLADRVRALLRDGPPVAPVVLGI